MPVERRPLSLRDVVTLTRSERIWTYSSHQDTQKRDMVGVQLRLVQHNQETSGSDATQATVVAPHHHGEGPLTYKPPNFFGLQTPQITHSSLPRVLPEDWAS